MAITTYTEEQYNALKQAIAEGVREVYYGDKRVVYRDLSEMKSILSDMRQELGIGDRKVRKYPSFSKGLL
jgi:hypothetical protein